MRPASASTKQDHEQQAEARALHRHCFPGRAEREQRDVPVQRREVDAVRRRSPRSSRRESARLARKCSIMMLAPCLVDASISTPTRGRAPPRPSAAARQENACVKCLSSQWPIARPSSVGTTIDPAENADLASRLPSDGSGSSRALRSRSTARSGGAARCGRLSSGSITRRSDLSDARRPHIAQQSARTACACRRVSVDARLASGYRCRCARGRVDPRLEISERVAQHAVATWRWSPCCPPTPCRRLLPPRSNARSRPLPASATPRASAPSGNPHGPAGCRSCRSRPPRATPR